MGGGSDRRPAESRAFRPDGRQMGGDLTSVPPEGSRIGGVRLTFAWAGAGAGLVRMGVLLPDSGSLAG
ncbi:hypothetical protein FMEAI12_2140003 [Parafrankia sp. Ea1.12]|nr:hypothetical protein FMEAI12_2140003 [Parafrankia sp. Ea1.12]